MVIAVTAEGSLHLNDQPVTTEDLKIALRFHSRDLLVRAQADRVTLHERFVGAPDEARGPDLQQVGPEVLRS